jgi:hypothetical protein
MAGHLSEADRVLIQQLREAEVLQDIDRHQLDLRQGVILITCSDGHRFPNIFNHQSSLMLEAGVEPIIHTLSWHGGALACAPCSPINRRKDDHKVFLEQVSDAIKLKGIYTILSHAHAPCGAAGLHGVDLTLEIALHMRAKDMMKKLENTFSKEIKVVPHFDVDYGEGKQRTYYLCRTKWGIWANEHGVKAIC